ncbi:MAG: hypothetical protein U9N14_06750, partial [Pseudomonadota bacterium]|nr:hypothetical protein [Pseudomonadota bacterium]
SSRLLTTIGGRIYPSRGARLARLMDTLARDGAKTRATLGGCLIAPMQFGRLVIAREPLKDRRLSVLDRPVLWDGRFLASTTSSQILHIGALLQGDMAQVKECSDPVLWSLLPHAARLACPGIFEGDTLVAVPHLGWSVPEVAVDFAPAVPLSTANFI